MKAKTMRAMAALALVMNLVAATRAEAEGEEGAASAAPAVRALAATARQFVRELPMPEVADHVQRCGATGADDLGRFNERRRELCRRFDLSLSGRRPPCRVDLARLRRWVGQLHQLGADARLFPDGTEEDARFSGSLALAQGYLDCASVLAEAAD